MKGGEAMLSRKTILPMLLVLFLCGCNDINDISEPPESEAVSETDTSEPQKPDGYPVEVNGIKFSAPPEKAAVLTPAAAEMIFEMGFGENVAVCGSLCDYPEAAAKLSKAGSAAAPDTELILSFSPDIVITESPISPDDEAALRNGGAEVMTLSVPENHTELYNEYLSLAQIFAGSDAKIYADRAMSDYYHETSASADMGSFLLIMNDNFSIATGDTLAGELFSNFGENIAENYSNYYMPEADAVNADPDVIFLSEDIDRDSFASAHKNLKAVKNNNVYRIDTSLFERPTARLSETARQVHDIAEKLSAESGE